jgi:hypothetical protein
MTQKLTHALPCGYMGRLKVRLAGEPEFHSTQTAAIISVDAALLQIHDTTRGRFCRYKEKRPHPLQSLILLAACTECARIYEEGSRSFVIMYSWFHTVNFLGADVLHSLKGGKLLIDSHINLDIHQ